MNIGKYLILGDQPIQDRDDDQLGFNSFLEPLAQRIENSKQNTPFAIGVFAPWGSGKTSVMTILKLMMESKGCITAWFEPWRYRDQAGVYKGLLTSLIKVVKANDNAFKELRRRRHNITKSALKLIYSRLMGNAGEELFDELLKEPWSPAVLHELEEAVEIVLSELNASGKDGNPTLLFIDDLDRCLPQTTIAVLEAVKMVLNRKNVVIVIGLAESEVVDSVCSAYSVNLNKDLEAEWGQKYLRKIIQYPFYLPAISLESRLAYVQHCLLISGIHDDLGETWYPVIESACRNLREVKWLLNRFVSELDKALASMELEQDFDYQILAPRAFFIMLLALKFPRFFHGLSENPGMFYSYQDEIINSYADENYIKELSHKEDEESEQLYMSKFLVPDDSRSSMILPFSKGDIEPYIRFGKVIEENIEIDEADEDVSSAIDSFNVAHGLELEDSETLFNGIVVVSFSVDNAVYHVSNFLPTPDIRHLKQIRDTINDVTNKEEMLIWLEEVVQQNELDIVAFYSALPDGETDKFVANQYIGTNELKVHEDAVKEALKNSKLLFERIFAKKA